MAEKSGSKESERRRSPRVRVVHELRVESGVGDESQLLAATSVDLNLGGIYCTLSGFLPLFSKLHIGLDLPVASEDGGIGRYAVTVEGVVVRIEPDAPDPSLTEHSCAIAFMNVDPDVELLLAKYLLQVISTRIS